MNKSRLMTFIRILFITALSSTLVFCSKGADTEKALQEANAKIQQLTDEASRLMTENESFHLKIKDLQTQNADLETKNKQIILLKRDSETRQGEFEAAEKKIAELEKYFNSITNQRKQLTNALTTLKAAHAKNLKNVHELETKLAQKDEIIDQANAQLEGLQARQNAETKEKETRIAELEQTKNDLTQKLHLATASLEQSKTAHADELKKRGALETVMQQREKELNAADARVQDLEVSQKKQSDRLHQIESVIQALKLDKDTALSHIQELQQAVAGSGDALAQMSANLSQSEKERDLAQNAMTQLKTTYAELVQEFESEIKNQEATIRGLKEKLSITFMDDILYDLSMVSVNPKAQQALEKIGQVLRQNRDNKIVVTGHTDNMPIKMEARDRFPSNWELSAARAAAVVRYFQNQLGIDPARMEIVGHAYYKPVANNDTPENRSKNRRVEIFIMPLQ